ncbi:MAG: class I SAM-dependent methyltransferase [Anaerolineae bacterium]|nr:class I SAM-dependent methyltransferase [Anaerolineae bacterium]
MKTLRDRLLHSPDEEIYIKKALDEKHTLKHLYREIYEAYAVSIAQAPLNGIQLELGSGVGFANQVIPTLVTSDILPFSNVDLILDATCLPFADNSISAILMNNVFHHIRNVEMFLNEADRCLMVGGRVLIADQNPGIFSKYIYKHLHHEYFNEAEEHWDFTSENPLRDANGALAWIVFQRDLDRYQALFPRLRLVQFKPHTPLRYWLCGGLKSWSLLPNAIYPLATHVDHMLTNAFPNLGSFAFIELEKVTPS